jgi:predicted PurR-regulated permease PerM
MKHISDSDYWKDAVKEEFTGQENNTTGQVHLESTETQATPIWISKHTRTVLLACGLVALVFIMWYSPSVPIMVLGGFALALVISYPVRVPVRALSRIMARGWAILASFLALVGVATLALVVLVPILISQLVSFISYVPEYAIGAEHLLCGLLEPLAQRGLLPGTPEEYITNLGQDLLNLAQSIAQQILGGLLDFISGTFNLVLTLLGVLFVAVYLLINVRNIKVSYLRVRPRHYRTDVRDLWDAFAFSLSRYLLGLGLRTTHHSAAKGPRVLPGPAVRGQRLPPRIQGQTLRIPSILIFLAIIAGGRSWVSSALSSPSQLWPCSGHSSISSAFAPS